LTFDLLTSGAFYYKVYVYQVWCHSSSRFLFRAPTNRDATERPTHAGGYTAGVGKYHLALISLLP